MRADREPRVSVILPTYNQIEWLPRAVQSVLEQTLADFELIVVDDGSTDGTAAWLDALTDPRVRVIHQRNARLPRALNRGMVEARGEYVTWTSSDNVCAPIMLEALVDALDANPDASMSVANFAWIDEQDRITRVTGSRDVSKRAMLARNPGIAAFLYRRSAHESAGYYDPTLEGAEDWDMWQRIAELGPVVLVPSILYYYREHAKSMSSTISPKVMSSSRDVFARSLVKRGGVLTLEEFYPSIVWCTDVARASRAASCDLARRILESPFADHGLAVRLLRSGGDVNGLDEHSRFNLALAHARIGDHPGAAMVVESLRSAVAPEVRAAVTTLRVASSAKDARRIEGIQPLDGSSETEEWRLREESRVHHFRATRQLRGKSSGAHRPLSFCIISNGRRPEMLEKVVASIRAQEIPTCEVIVAGSCHAIPGVIRVDAAEAGAQGRLGAMRNAAVARARFAELVMLDDDVMLSRSWYRNLLARGGSFDILTCEVRVPDGTRYWDRATASGIHGHALLAEGEVAEAPYMSGGVGWIMSRRVASTVKWDDARAFYQDEDLDFASRCRSAGFAIEHERSCVVYHADATYTQVGRRVFRRKDGRLSTWCIDAAAATPAEIADAIEKLYRAGGVAEASDLARYGVLRFPRDASIRRKLDQFERDSCGTLGESQFEPRGDPEFNATWAACSGMTVEACGVLKSNAPTSAPEDAREAGTPA